MRALRELEPPSPDEGFAAVEHVPFDAHDRGAGRAGVFVAAAALSRAGWEQAVEAETAPHLVFDWNPDGGRETLDAEAAAPLRGGLRAGRDRALPAPGAARRPAGAARRCRGCRSRSRARTASTRRARLLVGTGPAHRTLATTLGARYVEA